MSKLDWCSHVLMVAVTSLVNDTLGLHVHRATDYNLAMTHKWYRGGGLWSSVERTTAENLMIFRTTQRSRPESDSKYTRPDLVKRLLQFLMLLFLSLEA